jgi:hypothetical protein
MVIRLDIVIWGIGNGGTKMVVREKGLVGVRYGGCQVLWPLCVFRYISVVVEGACVRDCRGLGLCIVGTVGYSVGG